jgi:isocitrate/isopropylmalate dehydrogenase
MSHLSKGKCKIKDLFTLREVAKEMGLKVVEKKELQGDYIGNIKCEFVVSDGEGGELAIVESEQSNEYEIQMDNYYNSICDTVGKNGNLLSREYITEVHKKEAQLLGGVIASQEVDAQGYVYLEVHTP